MATNGTRRQPLNPLVRRRPPLRQALLVAEKRYSLAAPLLRRHPGVLGVGVGLRERRGLTEAEAVFVVTVGEKRDLAEGERLPREVLGIGVDVQVAAVARLARPPLPGQGIQSAESEPGCLGALGAGPDGRLWGVTAMHVIASTPPPTYFPPLQGPVPEVPVTVDGASPDIRFVLESGRLDSVSDLAWMEIRAPDTALADLRARLRALPKPLDPSAIHAKIEVGVLRGASSSPLGTFEQYPYGVKARDTGEFVTFEGLVRFRLPLDLGDSGSLIVAKDGAPIALLTLVEGNGYACGFPIHPYVVSSSRHLMGVQ